MSKPFKLMIIFFVEDFRQVKTKARQNKISKIAYKYTVENIA
jgi:hypothetical protein